MFWPGLRFVSLVPVFAAKALMPRHPWRKQRYPLAIGTKMGLVVALEGLPLFQPTAGFSPGPGLAPPPRYPLTPVHSSAGL